MPRNPFEGAKSNFEFVEIPEMPDITAFRILKEPFKEMIVAFTKIGFIDNPSDPLKIDYGYKVIRGNMPKEDFMPLKESFESLLSNIVKYVLVWADENNKMSLFVST